MASHHIQKSELVTGLETAVSATPDNVELRLLLVGHLCEGGHFADALTHATTVIQAQPDRTDAHRWAAQAAHELGDTRATAFERVARALTALEGGTAAPPRPAAPTAPMAVVPVIPAAPQPARTEARRPEHPPRESASVPVKEAPAPPTADAPAPPAPATDVPAPAAEAPTPAAPVAPAKDHSPKDAPAPTADVPAPAAPAKDAPVAAKESPRPASPKESPAPAPEPPAKRPAPSVSQAAETPRSAPAPERTAQVPHESPAPPAAASEEASAAEPDTPESAEPAPGRRGRRRGGALKRRQAVEAAETMDEPPVQPDAEDEIAAIADALADEAVDADDATDEIWEAPAERFVIGPEDIERPRVNLASIATDAVRDRFEAVVVKPLKSGGGARKATQGGTLLFGPDGCGKGFFARIVAGELGAGFLSVDMARSMEWPGDPRENIGAIFEAARGALPCVLYLDHIDRAGIHPDTPDGAADRRLLSRLASEISGAATRRGPIVFSGTTAPWQVDMTLLTNGRLDRSLVILPPDAAARESILRENLGDVPMSGVDLPWIIERTRHFSVDDLVALTDRATALAAISALGDDIVVGPGEMTRALREVRPGAPAWFSQVHENAVGGGSMEGMYDEVMTYMNANQLV